MNTEPAEHDNKAHRTGRGSLDGQITLDEDWDSAAVNEQIAADFGAGEV